MSYSKSKKATLISFVAIIIALTSLFGVIVGTSKSGSDGIPYQLHRGNLAVTWCFIHGIDNYLCIPKYNNLGARIEICGYNSFNCWDVSMR